MSSEAPKQDAAPASESKSLPFGLSLDMAFVKSIPGILTAAITIVSLVAFICVYASRNDFWCEVYNHGAFNFFGFVSMSAFLTGLIAYILALFSILQRFNMVPWALGIFIWSVVWGVLFFIASIVAAVKSCGQAGIIAGAIFGFLVVVFLGGRAFFAFMDFRQQRASSSNQSQPQAPPPQEYPQAPHY